MTGWQPPLLFEVAPLLMALVVVALSAQHASGRARPVGLALGLTALLTNGVGLAAEIVALPPVAAATATASSQLLILTGLVVVGLDLRRRTGEPLPLLLGVATLPLLLVGGALSTWHERLLELPVLALALGWVLLGARVAGRRSATAT